VQIASQLQKDGKNISECKNACGNNARNYKNNINVRYHQPAAQKTSKKMDNAATTVQRARKSQTGKKKGKMRET
jgi:hypothetical protein